MKDLSISQIKSFRDCLQKAESAVSRGDLTFAITSFQTALEMNPNSTAASHALGNLYLTMGKWEDTIALYEKVLAINPNFDGAYYNLGEAYSQLKQWEEAIVSYQQALDLNPNLPHVYQKLANSFYQRANLDRQTLLDNYQQKIDENPYEVDNYHQAIELNPQDVLLYYGLGNALVYNRKIDEAIVAYQMAVQIDPDYEPAVIQLDKLQNRGQADGSLAKDTISTPEQKLQQAKKVLENLSRIVLDNFLITSSKLTFPQVEEPRVSVILILYNRAELTLSCLHSLLHQSFHNYEVIIVDNKSSDRTVELLDRIEGATVVRNQENKHFLLAANQASKLATGEYLLFLNNDAQILGNSLEAAVQTISQDSEIGAVGGKIILPDGTLQEAGSIIWQDGSCLGYGRGDDPSASLYMFQREVDYCSGAFLLTPHQLFAELGRFDEAYQPAYYEETDYCVKIHQAGKKIIYDPQVSILHYEFASSTNSENAISLQQKNQALFVKKHDKWLHNQFAPDLSKILAASNRQGNGQRILFIDDRIPHPYLGSGYTRGHTMLKIMSELGHKVTFYPTDLSYQETWQTSYSDLPSNIELATNWGLQKLEDFIKSRPGYYDLVFVSRPHNMNHLKYILEQEDILPQAKIIYDAEALYCLRDFSYQALQGKQLSTEAKQIAIAKELELAQKSDLIISVSPLEQQKFLEYGYPNVKVLGHSLAASPTTQEFNQRRDILFVGSIYTMDSPNADSILWFTQEIFPLIQQQIDSEVRLLLVGNNKVPELQESVQATENPQIQFLGKVDTLYPLYNSSRLFIAPTRFAAGIAHKVHEAAAYGLPVVTTSVIADQLQWQSGQDLLAADSPEKFAKQCIRLYQDQSLWRKLRKNALKQIKNHCSPEYFKQTIQEILNYQ